MPAPSRAIREYQSDPPSQLPPTAARPAAAVPQWLDRSFHTRAFLRHQRAGLRQPAREAGLLPVFRTIGNATCATGWPRRRQRVVLLLMSSPLVPASYLTPQCRCGISRFQLAAPAATKANPAKAGGTKPRVLASSATPA